MSKKNKNRNLGESQINTMAEQAEVTTIDEPQAKLAEKPMPARSPRAQCKVCGEWLKCTDSRKGKVDYIRREVEVFREWECPGCKRILTTVDHDKILLA